MNDDLSAIIKTAKSFTDKELRPHREAADARSGEVLSELLKTLAGIGFFSMMCGGEEAEQGAAACAAFIGEVSRASPALGTALASHAMGLIPVLVFADESERKEIVRRTIESEERGEAPLFTLCWMEDAARLGGGLGLEEMETEVEGSGGCLTLRGRKIFIPAAEAAKNLTVLLKMEEGKFAFIVVPAEADGVAVAGAREMMGLRLCPFNDVAFDSVKILKDNALSSNVSAADVRKLFARFEACLGAVCVGMMQEAYAQAKNYAAGRYQAGKMIIAHDAVREMLAGMAAGIEKSRALVERASADETSPANLLCSVTAAEEAVKAALDGIQILGGYGYMKDYPLERILRDAKTFQTSVVLPQCRKMEFMKHETEKE